MKSQNGGTDRKKVLIVEDDPETSELLKGMLQRSNLEVVTVLDVFDAWLVFGDGFDVVLCDWVMPIVNGDVLYRKVQRAYPELCERFIFMTGHRPDSEFGESIEKFIHKINCLILYKPFPVADLLDAVQKVIGRQRSSE